MIRAFDARERRACAVLFAFAGPPGSDATWTMTFMDEFNGSSVDGTQWTVYDGSAQGFLRSKSHVTVSNGLLTIAAYKSSTGQWVTGGLSHPKQNFTYGRALARMRFDKGAGIRAVALLWPQVGWPPEIDFFEISGKVPNRDKVMFTNHYSSQNLMQHSTYAADFTQWHTLGVEWTPAAIKYTVDGQVVATQTGHVPSQPMHLALQGGIQAAPYAPDASTPKVVNYQVDWVALYKHN